MRDERVGPDQRRRAVAVLGRALDDGRLDLAEHDRRVAAVGAATWASQLAAQLTDLTGADGGATPGARGGPPVADGPGAGAPGAGARGGAGPPVGARRWARAALVLGVLSVPLAVCLVGGVLGVAAVAASVPGARGGRTAALAGRALGLVAIGLSAAALWALLGTRRA